MHDDDSNSRSDNQALSYYSAQTPGNEKARRHGLFHGIAAKNYQ
jgi:hypothetical protein